MIGKIISNLVDVDCYMFVKLANPTVIDNLGQSKKLILLVLLASFL